MLDELSVDPRPAGVLAVGDGHVRLFAEGDALRAAAAAPQDPRASPSADCRDTNLLLDKLGLYTTEVFQRGRERVIIRQQQELMELSTPVVTLWEGVLALPVIGTLDSARTQVVMENLLQRIVETRRVDRHHRHHRRADRRHAHGAAPAEDRRGRAADGRRLHHQRHPAADRADDRPPRRRSGHGHHEGDAGRRVRDRAEAARPRRRRVAQAPPRRDDSATGRAAAPPIASET